MTKIQIIHKPTNIVGFLLTRPGMTVPTAGDMVSGASSGTTNSKDVGPTGAISPEN